MLSDLIGICGKARHGKGEVASILVELGFRDVQFSASVKELALHIDPTVDGRVLTGELGEDRFEKLSTLVQEFGLEKVKAIPEVRRLLQQLGNGAREIVHPDTWVRGFQWRHGAELLGGSAKLVVSDMRYPNEAAMVRELGGEVWKIVRINPDGTDFDNGLGEMQFNASETAVDEIHPNLTILNDGTLPALRHKVKQYLVRRAFE